MPRQQDITDETNDEDVEDQELEEDEDSEGDDDDSPDLDDKPAPQKRRSAPRNEDMSDIRQQLAELKAIAAGGNREDKQKVSKVDQMFEKLLNGGYKKEQLAALAGLVESLKEDLRAEYGEATEKATKAALDSACWTAIDKEIEKYADSIPAVEWAKDTIRRRVRDLVSKSPEAQHAYSQGKVPPQNLFAKATKRITETYLKASGIKQGGSSSNDQLDVKNSRVKPGGAIAKDGEVDVDKLSDFERNIYVTTLNITKNKELALDALKALRAGTKK